MFLTETRVNLWHTYGPLMKVLCCCLVCLIIQRKKNRWFLWWSAWFNHGVGPSSRQKMWSDRRKLWRAVGILVTNPHVFKNIPANTWLNTNYDIIVTSKYQQQLTKHVTNCFCIYIYIFISRVQLGCWDSWCCGVISNFEKQKRKEKTDMFMNHNITCYLRNLQQDPVNGPLNLSI